MSPAARWAGHGKSSCERQYLTPRTDTLERPVRAPDAPASKLVEWEPSKFNDGQLPCLDSWPPRLGWFATPGWRTCSTCPRSPCRCTRWTRRFDADLISGQRRAIARGCKSNGNCFATRCGSLLVSQQRLSQKKADAACVCTLGRSLKRADRAFRSRLQETQFGRDLRVAQAKQHRRLRDLLLLGMTRIASQTATQEVTCPLPPYQSNVGSPGLKG